MPSKELLEDFPLYRKQAVDMLPDRLDLLPEVRINMYCTACASKQTFAMVGRYSDGFPYVNHPCHGLSIRII